MPVSASNIEKFSRGEAIVVEVDHIERELAALWQAASRDAHDSGASPVARAALWNIIIPTLGAESLLRTKRLVDDLAPSIPARVITLCHDDGAPPGSITATIEGNVISRPSGARVVYSEEITLTADSTEERHFGALVRSLQIPSLPTATLLIDPTTIDSQLTRELLPLSDRLVVDTVRCAGPAELAAVCRLATTRRTDVTVGDLGWLRLASFRLLFAGLFDPPVGGGPLLAARRITILHRPARVASALLLAAWLGCQLGWEPHSAGRPDQRTDDPPDDLANAPRGQAPAGVRLRFGKAGDRSGGGAAVEVDLLSSEGECGTSGIVAIWLASADGAPVYAVRRTADNHAEICIPIAPTKTVKLDSRADAELCLGALGPAGRDPLLRRVLPYAGRLAALVAARSAG
jgi:hypothetical protein